MNMRRSSELPLYRYRFGSAEFDESRFELRVGGLEVEVQRKPLEVLRLFLQRAGEVVTKEEFLEEVWDGRPAVDNVVGNALAKLRAALGDDNGALILTQARVGYRLVGPTERLAVGKRFSSVLQLAPHQPVPHRENFFLERLIGQSRGSEVWLARHAKTKEPRVYKFSRDGEQFVALKREATLYRVLKDGLGPRPDFLRIIDWSFETPPFFLECEYGGEDLARWADSAPLHSLPMDQRLALFQQIVEGIAAAHSIGVLHKDINPNNLLIEKDGGQWRVRISDFGSGRLLEPDRLAALRITALDLTPSESGVGVDTTGTPLYTAPEILAGGTPSVQSDVYSLGLILYQLVVGDLRKPMVSGWDRDLTDELLREDIASATDGNPAHRPASAEEMAKRLRHLEDRRAERVRLKSVQAEAQAAAASLQRSRARRPWLIAVIASLALGLSASLLFYGRAKLESRHAELEAGQAQAINRFLNEDLLSAADPTAPGSISNTTVREVLVRASGRIEAQADLAPAIKASIYTTLGNAYAGLNDFPSAETHLRRAIAASADAGSQTLRAKAEYALAAVLLNTSKPEEARSLLDRADLDAGEALQAPGDLSMQAHLTRGYVDDNQSLEDQALAEFEIADQIRRSAAPDDAVALFKVRLELINSYIAARRYVDAEKATTSLLAPEFTTERVGVIRWARLRELDGEILSNSGDYEAAVRADLEGLEALRKGLGAKHYDVGVALSELSNVYVDSGRLADALAPSREAYEIMTQSVGADTQNAILARGNLGILESKLGKAKEGISDMRSMRDALIKLLGSAANPQVQVMDYYLAASLSEIGEQAEAWSFISRVNPEAVAQAGEGGQDWEQRIQGVKGQILLRQGHKSDAVALLEPALQKMQADHIQNWILDPMRTALAMAKE